MNLTVEQAPAGRWDRDSGSPLQGQQQGAGGNFAFLTGHAPVFLELASSAERAFAHDPNTTLIKLRQLGEAMSVIDSRTGEVESAELEDELDFEVEAFNRRVIAPEFNCSCAWLNRASSTSR